MKSIVIVLNGQRKEIPHGWSIHDLLSSSGAEPNSVAVVVNAAIVRSDRHSTVTLKENDEVDILVFAGGG